MQITRQADYALLAVLFLAKNREQRTATSQVAQEQHIPHSFLAKIIAQLTIAGLLHTCRGARGGVTLARDPKDISLLEVVEAIDGPIQLNECVGKNGACAFEHDCPLRPVWCDVQNELVQRLKSINFAQLLQQSSPVETP